MDITLVYFVYGLAFFSMGLALMMEAGRSPLMAEARVLRPLAIFGFLHGSHEWLEMFLDKSDWMVFQDPAFVTMIRVTVLSLSFIALALFGLRVLQTQNMLTEQRVWYVWFGIGICVMFIAILSVLIWTEHLHSSRHVDAMVRYLVAVPAAVQAGLALNRSAKLSHEQGTLDWGRPMRWAALGFVLYGMTQAVVPPIEIFPGNWLNTESFTAWSGLPIQFIRAVLAVLITVALIRATRVADELRQQQFIEAQKARLQALEQVQEELIKREAQRRELLRHIVIAQEEERGRIARELHDETSQVLTAFTLHLATLRKVGDVQFVDQIDHLQTLSRQMSQAIYRLIYDLRPAQLDDLGLLPALKNLIDVVNQRFGLKVELKSDNGRCRLGRHIETVLFRVAQEGLSNVARHALVNDAQIHLGFYAQEVFLRITDRGVGFDVNEYQLPPRGWGLAGMRERAESVGGMLKLQSAPGMGTIIEVVVPLEKEILDGCKDPLDVGR